MQRLIRVLNNEDVEGSREVVKLLTQHDFVRPMWADFCQNIHDETDDKVVLEQIHLLKQTTQRRLTNRPGERANRQSCAVPLDVFFEENGMPLPAEPAEEVSKFIPLAVGEAIRYITQFGEDEGQVTEVDAAAKTCKVKTCYWESEFHLMPDMEYYLQSDGECRYVSLHNKRTWAVRHCAQST